jgi:glucokinase
MEQIVLGTDIGGSHITCQLFNLTTGKPLSDTRCRIEVDCHALKNEILTKWISAIHTALKDYSLSTLSGIGFAMPGPFDYPNGIAWFNGVQKYEALYGVNIRNEIQERLNLPDSVPVHFLNDASCFAIGETWLGEASNYKRIIALTLGTGFGATFINDGLPLAGTEGIPDDGFLYHIPFQDSIADDYFSTRWFLNTYLKVTGVQAKGVRELFIMAHSKPIIAGIFQEFGKNLGEFLAPWIKKFSADCIVLGGNISKSLSFFKPDMEVQFKKNNLHPVILLSKLGENAALIGSARLCSKDYYSRLM